MECDHEPAEGGDPPCWAHLFDEEEDPESCQRTKAEDRDRVTGSKGGYAMTTPVDRRTVAKGAGALAGVAAVRGLMPMAASADEATPTEPSLYERVGGIFAIAAVVERFSDQIITNPKLNVNPALKAWNETEAATRLPGLKFMRTLWIAAVAGGPFDYTGLPLHEAHQEFHLTADEFNEVGAEIVRALDYYKVPEREKQELVEAYSQSMKDVVTASS
jgi:hemoglobin